MVSSTQAASKSMSVVLVGPLSPATFQPRWLASQGLLSAAEAKGVEDLVVTPEFSQFSTEWLLMNSTGEKVTLTTQLEPYFDVLRDLAVSLVELVGAIPLAAVGLNSIAHFDLGSAESWHRVGHTLAPKVDIWDDITLNPGTRRLMIEAQRAGRPGAVNVAIEPSALVAHGVFIEVNDHFVNPDWPESHDDWAVDLIMSEWLSHSKNAESIFERVVSLGNAQATKQGAGNG